MSIFRIVLAILDRFNEIIDFLLLYYLIFSITVIAVFLTVVVMVGSKRSATEEPDHTYNNVNTDTNDWRMKYIGKWIKIERLNFYEVIV
jgi:hypothetical protein